MVRPLSSLALSAFALAAAACGADPKADPRPATAVLPPSASVVPSTPSPPSVSASAHAEAPPPPDPGPPFPPPAVAPLHERTAKPGDGAWEAWGPVDALAKPHFYRARVHPHAFKPDPFVVLVAIDLRRAEPQLVAGTTEPESKLVPKERRTGLVPNADHDALLAVHNGGFQAAHGKYGMRVGAELFVPARDGACDIAITHEGLVKIGPHASMGDLSPFQAFRQTPPCLVEGGALPKALDDETSKRWGSALGGNTEVRRSAWGIDATGNTLFYGYGDWVTPKMLASALRAAGSVAAAELDINYSYTFFVLYGRTEKEGLHANEAIAPDLKWTRKGHIERPVYRDFFYFRRRAPR
jgi:hypothetical protein